jgi:hypothetical protein
MSNACKPSAQRHVAQAQQKCARREENTPVNAIRQQV